MLAGIASEIDSDLLALEGGVLLEHVVNNEALLQVLEQFTANDKLTGISNIGFMSANGVQPLCKLYKSLLLLQAKLFEKKESAVALDESAKQTLLITRVLVMSQKEILAKILQSFLNFGTKPRKFLP